MNAQSPASALTVVSVQNADILRAFAAGPLDTPKDVAMSSGRDVKNIARQIELMQRDGLVTTDKPFDLTDTGRRALQAINLADGLGPAGAADIIELRHHQLRPNPNQPRQHFDEQALEELAATIHEAGDVLQNLVAFPADAEGVHDIAAGERRWRAVGLLIERGLWPQGRPLRALIRERSPGQVAYLALVENRQRENLTIMEEARAYASMIEETGVSARDAALKTGRDPRTVQEMMKVLREASPEDIARHEADPRDFTWEKLRDSVKAPTVVEPVQRDVEEQIAEAGGPLVRPHPSSANNRAWDPCSLTVAQRYALAELAHKVASAPVQTIAAKPSALIRENADQDQDFRTLYRHGYLKWGARHDGSQFALLSTHGADWVERNPFPTGDVSKGYQTRWLNTEDSELVVNGVRFANITRAEEARMALRGGAPSNGGGGAKPQVQAPPMRDLDAHERLALMELALKLKLEPTNYRAMVTDQPWAQVRKYWLDKTCAQITSDLRLVQISHQWPGGPHATLTPAGEAWIKALPAQGLESLIAQAHAEIGWDGVTVFATPWLNVELFDQGEPGGQGGPDNDPDDDDDDEVADADALKVLHLVSKALDDWDDFDRPAAFTAAGIAFPLRAGSRTGLRSDLGVIYDANGKALLTVDSDGELPEDLVKARVLLVMATLNATIAEWAVPMTGSEDRTEREPSVPIRRSITPETITCLEDGRRVLSLTPHLRSAYGLTPDAYRSRWGLPKDYPMVAPNYAKLRHEQAQGLRQDAPWSEDDQ